jgi:hypothetical protein
VQEKYKEDFDGVLLSDEDIKLVRELMPIMKELFKVLEAGRVNASVYILRKGFENGLRKLEKYYPRDIVSKDIEVSAFATILDPRFKLRYFKHCGWN